MDPRAYPPNHQPDLHETWSQAHLVADQGDPFCCTPAWQMAFHDAFAPKRRLLIESSSGGVVAFAEHRIEEEVFLTPIEASWMFGSPLLGDDAVAMLADLLPEILKTYSPAVPKILISGIQPDSQLPLRLLGTLGNHFDFYLHSGSLQCAASLEGGFDGYLSRRSGNHRKKLKKQLRIAAGHDIHFERVQPASPEEATEAYVRIIDVELRSWKGIEKCGMAETPSREFYDSMTQRLATNKEGRVIFAKHDDTDIGFIFGGLAGAIYRGQQFSYDQDWKDYSIGNLMQVEQLKWLCEDGASRYDMGPIVGPKMGYKKHWTEINLAIETWLLVKR